VARFAVKRLAAVEVDPERSHQHELNAGLLRRTLGISADRVSGVLSILFYESDDRSPSFVETPYTLYDARENTPDRQEYRLYFETSRLLERASPGDLLIIFRVPGRENDLQGMVVARGTRVEREILEALELDDRRALARYLGVTPARLDPRLGEQIALDLSYSDRSRSTDYPTARHPLYRRCVVARDLPATAEMARAGRELATMVHGEDLDPDSFIETGLDAETALYYDLEQEIRTPELVEILSGGSVDLAAILTFARSVSQTRASRRGYSLEHHLAALLVREEIEFETKCETEAGRHPDFLLPGCAAYHDPTFPSERLRMVACKTTVRERWPQVLDEAARIPAKYFLTLDPDLARELLRRLTASGLQFFIPQSILREQYPGLHGEGLLASVADLVGALRENQNRMRSEL